MSRSSQCRLILIFLTMFFVNSNSLALNESLPNLNAVHRLIMDVAGGYFQTQELIILDCAEEFRIVIELSKNISWPVQVFSREGNSALTNVGLKSLHKRAHSYVFLGTAENVRKAFIRQTEQKSWNSTAKFLVYIDDRRNSSLEQLFATFWHFFAPNVVIGLRCEKNRSSEISLFTIFPYRRSDGQCGQRDLSVTFLDTWKDDHFVNKTNLYPEKLPKTNFKGCTVKANLENSTYRMILKKRQIRDNALEFLFETFAEQSNMTFKMVRNPFKYPISEDESRVASIRHALDVEGIDVVLGEFILFVDRWFAFQANFPIFFDKIAVVVPCISPTFSNFSLNLMALLPLLLLVYIFSVMLVYIFSCESNLAQGGLTESFLDVWRIFMESSLPKLRMNSNRVWFIMLLWYFVAIFNGSERCVLNSESTFPRFYESRKSFKDVLNSSSTPIGFRTTPLMYMLLNNSKTFNRNRHRLVDCSMNWTSCVEKLTSGGNLALACSPSTLQESVPQYACYNPLSKDLGNYLAVTFLRKGNPLAERFDRLIMLAHSAGIVKHITSLQKKPIRSKPKGRSPLENLPKFAFFIWTVGMLVATLHFLISLLLNWKKGKPSVVCFKVTQQLTKEY